MMTEELQAGPEAPPDGAAGQWAERAAAWRRWTPQWAAQTRAATDLVIAAACITPGLRVLDVASGGGEPALTLAALVGVDGRVAASDVSAAMLAIAQDAAQASGYANISFTVAGAEQLPFADASFDAVTCRFGIAHVPDHARALREIRRVLRPGGWAAFVVWGPRIDNPFFSLVDDALALFPLPSPAAARGPGPCTFAVPGSLSQALDRAGFRDINEETRRIVLRWPGPAAAFWQGRSEMSATASRRRAELAPEDWAGVEEVALTALRAYDEGSATTLPGVVVMARGTV